MRRLLIKIANMEWKNFNMEFVTPILERKELVIILRNSSVLLNTAIVTKISQSEFLMKCTWKVCIKSFSANYVLKTVLYYWMNKKCTLLLNWKNIWWKEISIRKTTWLWFIHFVSSARSIFFLMRNSNSILIRSMKSVFSAKIQNTSGFTTETIHHWKNILIRHIICVMSSHVRKRDSKFLRRETSWRNTTPLCTRLGVIRKRILRSATRVTIKIMISLWTMKE